MVESHDLTGVTYHKMLLYIVLPVLEYSPLQDNNKLINGQQEGLLCVMACKFYTSSVTTYQSGSDGVILLNMAPGSQNLML